MEVRSAAARTLRAELRCDRKSTLNVLSILNIDARGAREVHCNRTAAGLAHCDQAAEVRRRRDTATDVRRPSPFDNRLFFAERAAGSTAIRLAMGANSVTARLSMRFAALR